MSTCHVNSHKLHVAFATETSTVPDIYVVCSFARINQSNLPTKLLCVSHSSQCIHFNNWQLSVNVISKFLCLLSDLPRHRQRPIVSYCSWNITRAAWFEQQHPFFRCVSSLVLKQKKGHIKTYLLELFDHYDPSLPYLTEN